MNVTLLIQHSYAHKLSYYRRANCIYDPHMYKYRVKIKLYVSHMKCGKKTL